MRKNTYLRNIPNGWYCVFEFYLFYLNRHLKQLCFWFFEISQAMRKNTYLENIPNYWYCLFKIR
jgi:fumarate reductase subunit C